MSESFQAWGEWAAASVLIYVFTVVARGFFPNRWLLLPQWQSVFKGLPVAAGLLAGVLGWGDDIGVRKALIYGGMAGVVSATAWAVCEMILKRLPEVATNRFFSHFGVVPPAPATPAAVALVKDAVADAVEVAAVVADAPPAKPKEQP